MKDIEVIPQFTDHLPFQYIIGLTLFIQKSNQVFQRANSRF